MNYSGDSHFLDHKPSVFHLSHLKLHQFCHMNPEYGDILSRPVKKTKMFIQNQTQNQIAVSAPGAPSRFQVVRATMTFRIELKTGIQLNLQKFSCFQGATLFRKQRASSEVDGPDRPRKSKMQGILFKAGDTFIVLYDTGKLHVSAASESACDALVKKLGRMSDVCHGSDIHIVRRFLEFTVAVTRVDFMIDQMYFHYKNYKSFIYEPCLSPYVVGRIDGISVMVAESGRFLMCGDMSTFPATEQVVLGNLRPHRLERFVVARDQARLAQEERFFVVDSEGTHIGFTGIRCEAQDNRRNEAQEQLFPASQA